MPASKEELIKFMAESFPQSRCEVIDVWPGGAAIAREVGEADLRPGGTISGPTLMAAADVALYVAILGHIGIVPLAVTTSLNINFLRKPAAGRRIIAKCQLLKTGRTLVVGDVHLFSEGLPQPVAHAVGTYSIPPNGQA
jgi:acyl-coenzyme A thioesterase PaaI-like protein